MTRRISTPSLLGGILIGLAVMPMGFVGAGGATPFEVAATIDCTGTIAWAVIVGAEFGQVVKVDAIEDNVIVGLGLVSAPDAGTYTGAGTGFDTSLSHQVRFQRINEGIVQEQATLTATVICTTGPGPADTTPPQVTAAVDGTPGLLDWYVSDVGVAFTVADPESVPTAVGCEPVVISVDTTGVTLDCTASSAGGERTLSLTIKRDTTPPVVTCVTGVSRFLIGQPGAVVEATVTDATSGANTPMLTAPVDTGALGAGSVTLTTADLAGNETTAVCDYEIVEPGAVDATPPDVKVAIDGTRGLLDWYVSDVHVRFIVTDAESAPTAVGCEPAVISDDTIGTTLDCTATSDGGGGALSVTIRRDATSPTITCVTGLRSFVVGQPGAVVEATVDDATSGAIVSTLTADIDTAAPGAGSVSLATTDAAGNAASTLCEYEIVQPTVADSTPPVVDVTIAGVLGTNQWLVSDAKVSWTVSDLETPFLVDAGCVDLVVVDDTRDSVESCTASSAGGTTTETITVKRDATPPTVTCPATPTFVVGQSGGTITASVTDATSGPVHAAIVAAADTSTVGTRTVDFTGIDRAGNSAQQSCGYVVARDDVDREDKDPRHHRGGHRPPKATDWLKRAWLASADRWLGLADDN